MKKSIWLGALWTALVAFPPSAAHAEEFDDYDMCFSMVSEQISNLKCGTMKDMFDDAIEEMREAVNRQYLKGKSKDERKQYLESHGKEWLVALVGMRATVEHQPSACAPIAQDTGTWYLYRRGVEEPEKSVRTKTGLLGHLVTPRQQMVCLNWQIPLQAPVEKYLSKKIAERFFAYRFMGQIMLDELQIRTE